MQHLHNFWHPIKRACQNQREELSCCLFQVLCNSSWGTEGMQQLTLRKERLDQTTSVLYIGRNADPWQSYSSILPKSCPWHLDQATNSCKEMWDWHGEFWGNIFKWNGSEMLFQVIFRANASLWFLSAAEGTQGSRGERHQRRSEIVLRGETEEGVLPSFLLLSLNWPTHVLNGPIKRYNFFTFPALGPCEFLLFGFP